MALVSVIIPVYNAGRFVGPAINSVLSQTFPDFEIILVDDKSTDDTVKVLKALARTDKRIRVYEQPTNGGPAAARNRGMQEAKGEWLALLDDDDTYKPERLEVMLAAAKATNADIVFDNLIMFDITTGRETGVAIPNLRTRHTLTAEEFIRKCAPGHEGVKYSNLKALFKRTLFTTHGIRFPTSYRYGEDMMFYTELLFKSTRTILIPAALYLYTMQVSTTGQKSPHTRTIVNIQQLISATDDLITKWQATLSPSLLTLLRQRRQALCRQDAWLQLRHSIKHRHYANILKALLKHPFLFITAARQLTKYLARQGQVS